MGEEDSRQTIHAASAATPQEGTSKKRPRREVLMEVGAPGNGIVSRSANALTPRHDHLKSRYWAQDPSLRRHGSYTLSLPSVAVAKKAASLGYKLVPETLTA